MKLLCVLIGHRMGTRAAEGSWYDRCPNCGKCVLRPVKTERGYRDPPRKWLRA